MNNFKWSISNKHDWTITEDDFRNDNWTYYCLVNDKIVPIMHIYSPYRVGPNHVTSVTLYDNRQFCKIVDIFYILDKQGIRQYKIEQIV